VKCICGHAQHEHAGSFPARLQPPVCRADDGEFHCLGFEHDQHRWRPGPVVEWEVRTALQFGDTVETGRKALTVLLVCACGETTTVTAPWR
jgi:hypothetical protein